MPKSLVAITYRALNKSMNIYSMGSQSQSDVWMWIATLNCMAWSNEQSIQLLDILFSKQKNTSACALCLLFQISFDKLRLMDIRAKARGRNQTKIFYTKKAPYLTS